MLTLSNGHSFTVCCASGALAYGRGWWWERLALIPLGVIDPSAFTVITKTLTAEPRKGNLRAYAPWRCVAAAPLSGRTVNAVGMTNPGLKWWLDDGYDRNVVKTGRKTIVSVWPETVAEAVRFAVLLNNQKVVGVEVNVSCPNVGMKDADKTAHVVEIVSAVAAYSRHPVGVKLSALDRIVPIAKALEGKVEWLDLVNTVPFSKLYPGERSPLARHGLDGGVSGPPITGHARTALRTAMGGGVRTPVVSGGGVWDVAEARYRLQSGAAAVSLGTLFLLRPWRPNRIAETLAKDRK